MKVKPLTSLLIVGLPFFVVLSLGVDTVSRSAGHATVHGRQGWDWVASIFSGAWTILAGLFSLVASFPRFAAGLVVVCFVVGCIRAVARHAELNAPRDPQRMFSKEQRQQASLRAGGQCEMEGMFWRRCPRPGAHGDHFYPHSRGGATNQANHVWACAPCNLAKGAKVPTIWQKLRLERRRRRYFPPDQPVEVGAKYKQVTR